MPPQLLVSVRSAAEAAAALRGAADIIDVKEPAQGALGRASWQTIAEVVQTVVADSPRTPVSAALGECTDWDTTPHTDTAPAGTLARNDRLRAMLRRLTYVKLGPAGLVSPLSAAAAYATGDVGGPDVGLPARPLPNDDSGNQLWPARLSQLRANLLEDLTCTERGENSDHGPAWVSVAYADHLRAAAPSPAEILDHAVHCGSPVLLLDTFQKDQTHLLDWLSVKQLTKLRAECHREGIRLAVAGRLSLTQLAAVRQVQPDIVAVRGAACDSGNRRSPVSTQRIAELKHQLQQW